MQCASVSSHGHAVSWHGIRQGLHAMRGAGTWQGGGGGGETQDAEEFTPELHLHTLCCADQGCPSRPLNGHKDGASTVKGFGCSSTNGSEAFRPPM